MKIVKNITLAKQDSLWLGGEPNDIYEERQHSVVDDSFVVDGINFIDVTTAENIERFQNLFASYREARNQMITSILPNWINISTAEKKALVRNFVFPPTETQANLDLLYSLSEREQFRNRTIIKLNEDTKVNIKFSSDSSKFWNMITNNAGVLNTTEFLSNTIL